MFAKTNSTWSHRHPRQGERQVPSGLAGVAGCEVCRDRLGMSVAELARVWTEAARDQRLATAATSASGRAKPAAA